MNFLTRPCCLLLIRLWFVVAIITTSASGCDAQIKKAKQDSPIKYGAVEVTRFQVGVKAKTRGSSVQDVLAIVAVPLACDEQDVQLVDEDVSPQVGAIEYRMVGTGARQMMVRIPHLENGGQAHALMTFEVRTKIVLPPTETAGLKIPSKPDRNQKIYLGRSPFIEVNHRELKKLLKEINKNIAKDATDWQRVEAIYNHVQDAVEYVEGPDKSALQTLRDAQGDCQNISALFVALCRTSKIPARIVWVHEHSYAEFCLVNEDGTAYWFPIESSGTRAFGEMPLARTILQKGDNFKLPEKPRERLRYASDYATAKALPGGSKPRIEFVRIKL